jgi:hypothetical protein
MELQVHLDEVKYTSKPTEDISSISNRIVNNPVEITIQKLAESLTSPNGKTWLPAVLEGKRSNDNWKQQQVFALDFDSGITFNTVLTRLQEYGLDCTFAYSTFSNSPEKAKFRVVFQLDHVVTDIKSRKKIQLAFIYLFPEVDKQCTDPCRFFFGGKELIHENYGYYLDTDKLLDAAVIYGVKESKKPDKEIKRIVKRFKMVQKPSMPKYILGTDGKSTKNDNTNSTENKLLDHVNFEELRKGVTILDDFMKGEKILHPQLFGLATNLRYIEGGQKLFKQCLDLNPNYAPDKYKIMPYIKQRQYSPMLLENFSPYEEDWEYKNLLEAAKLTRGTVRRITPYQTITLQKAQMKLDKAFNDALADTGNNIWIIKKATGLGGTEKLLDLQSVTIAFPNHALKDEVSKRFKVPHLVTPGLPDCIDPTLKEKLEYYYSVGATEKANKLIKDESITNSVLADYLTKTSAAYKSKDTVLTTHTKALYVPFNSNTLIFDEDPLSSILETGETTLNDINRLVQAVNNSADKAILKEYQDIIINRLSNCIETTEKIINFNDLEAMENIVLNSSNYTSSILKFLNSDYYCLDSQNVSEAIFIKHNPLPLDKKIIILSATASEWIYKQLYGNRVKFVDISNVELTGMIEQDTKYSCSRRSLNNKNAMNEAVQKVGNLPTITFNSYKGQFPNSVNEMHFGKTTGFDDLKGKDIAVVGTPHLKTESYLLYAKVLGITLNPQDFELSTQRIKHNGFEFRIFTFSRKELQQIQFHFIEEQIRQAVGRARVVRESATVLLLSGYPLPEACISDDEKKLVMQRLEKNMKVLEAA